MNTIIEEIRKRIKAQRADGSDAYDTGQNVGLSCALSIIDEVVKQSLEADAQKAAYQYAKTNRRICSNEVCERLVFCGNLADAFKAGVSFAMGRAICNPLDMMVSVRAQEWKPTEEQLTWLETAVRLSADKPHIHDTIKSLYEQLKQL